MRIFHNFNARQWFPLMLDVLEKAEAHMRSGKHSDVKDRLSPIRKRTLREMTLPPT